MDQQRRNSSRGYEPPRLRIEYLDQRIEERIPTYHRKCFAMRPLLRVIVSQPPIGCRNSGKHPKQPRFIFLNTPDREFRFFRPRCRQLAFGFRGELPDFETISQLPIVIPPENLEGVFSGGPEATGAGIGNLPSG